MQRRCHSFASLGDPAHAPPPLYTSGANDPHIAAIAMPVFGADERQDRAADGVGGERSAS